MKRPSFGARVITVCGLAVAAVIGQGFTSPAAAEPTMTLKVPAFRSVAFANGSSIVLPEHGHGDMEIWLQDALAEIQVSTIRVVLNDVPLATFLTINRMPRGVRVIVKLGLSINPDFLFKSGQDNLLSFFATDTSSVSYRAQFYVTLNAEAAAPRVADRAPARPAVREVAAPQQVFPPTVALKVDWPAKTVDRVVTLDAEVSDREGLRRVVIEVNSKAIEEVVLENEIPVRKQRGFIAKSKLPGSVVGDSRKLMISIPVTLNKGLNVVGLRTENQAGLIGYADRTIELNTR